MAAASQRFDRGSAGNLQKYARRKDIPTDIYPHVQNCVANFDLGVKVELEELQKHIRGSQYNPKKFKALVVKNKDCFPEHAGAQKSSALIFASGKIIINGAKSEAETLDSARMYQAQLVQARMPSGGTIREEMMNIANMVGSAHCGWQTKLEGVYRNCLSAKLDVTWDPEVFAGLTIKMNQPSAFVIGTDLAITVLVFESGKLVFTGSKREAHIVEAFEALYDLLLSNKK